MYEPFVFRFKQFEIHQDGASYKIGTDSILLGAWSTVTGVRRAIDLGAGSGVLALMLAQRSKDILIDAIEIDPAVVAEAEKNVALSPWSDRIRVVEHDVANLNTLPLGKYDLVISNAPYFSGGLRSPGRFREQARHGIEFQVLDLPRLSAALLLESGIVSTVMPATIAEEFIENANSEGLFVSRRLNVKKRSTDKPGLVLLECTKRLISPVHDEIILTENAKPTQAYADLCGDFIEVSVDDWKV